MSIEEYIVNAFYIGEGNNDTYSFDMKIVQESDLRIVIKDVDGEIVADVRGADGIHVTSIQFDEINGGGEMTLASDLATGYELWIFNAPEEPTQPSKFRDKSDFKVVMFEAALDFITAPLMWIAYQMTRTLKMPVTYDMDGFDPQLPSPVDNETRILQLNDTATGFEYGATFAEVQALIDSAANSAADAATAQAGAEAAEAAAAAAEAASLAAQTAAQSAQDAAEQAAQDAQTAADAAAAVGGDVEQFRDEAVAAAADALAAQIAAEAARDDAEAALVDCLAAVADAQAAQAAAEAAAASVLPSGWIVTGSKAAPVNVASSGTITPGGYGREKIYVQGNGAPATNVSIADGLNDGDELILCFCHATRSVEVKDGNNTKQNGDIVGFEYMQIRYSWDLSNWVEEARNY